MLLLILLVLISWVCVPGLLTGWMLREHGRNFFWGLLVGAVFGPAGILAALAFIYASERRPRRGRAHAHGRGFRAFYIIPFVGRLHVSTAWSLAGVVAFLCAWMIGGLGYELYSARYRLAAPGSGLAAKLGANQTGAPTAAGVAPNQLREVPDRAAPAQANPSRPPTGPLLSGLAAQTGQAAQVSGAGESAPAQTGQTPAGPSANGPAPGATPASNPDTPSETAAASPTAPPTAPARPAAPSREAAISEVLRGLGGHRVHIALSGDAQTATLSISGPTLTRQTGNQLLGRSRQSLKAAGIRIVVINNGPESWTYIL